MRKILTHPVIFLLGIVLVIGFLFTGAKKVGGFSWFALWSKNTADKAQNNIYVQKTFVDDIVVNILQAHASLNKGLISSKNLSGTTSLGSINSIPGFLGASQNLLMTDIVTYLENASNKEAALDSYLSQLEYFQGNGESYKSQLQEIISQGNAEYTICTNAKDSADTMFYQGLREGDSALLEEGLQNSKTQASCQAVNRVIINAHKAMLQRIDANNQATTKLVGILTQNRELIIAHFELFKGNYLEKLATVRNALRQASTGTN